MKRRFLVIVSVCVLALALGVTPAVGKPMGATIWSEWMPITPITYDGPADPAHTRLLPDVQGDWIVYADTLDSAEDWNIRAYNMRARTHKTVCAAPDEQKYPRVYGNWVVWQDGRYGAPNLEIYARNLATNTAERRLTNRAGIQRFPDISGTRVVYEDGAAGDIYLYDLATGRDTVLPLGTGTQTKPAISGDRVVYVQSNDIYVYDLRTGVRTPLTSDGVQDGMPDIDGTLVAWQKQGASIDIWTQDLAGGAAGAVFGSSAADDEEYPRVDGKHVVYMRNLGHLDWNIFIHDEPINRTIMLTQDAGDDVVPAIDGVNIVYTSGVTDGPPIGGEITLGRLVGPIATTSAGPGTVKYGGKTTISGTITENGIPFGSLAIAIDRSTDGGHTWSQVKTLNTNASGAYSYATPALYKTTLYRARDNGATWYSAVGRFSALSDPTTVKVKVSLSKPSGKKSISNTKSYTYYGYLKPGYTAGTDRVWIKCYKKSGGKYKYKKTYTATLSNYNSYSKYSRKIKLTTEGKWRIRAQFKATSTNAETYSSWKYVTSN